MRWPIHVALGLMLVLPSWAAAQTVATGDEICRAGLNGDYVMTTLEMPDGQEFHGPWRIRSNEATVGDNGERGLKVSLVLDAMIQVDPLTGEQSVLRLPEPVGTTVEGSDMEEVVEFAARIWCTAIMNAHETEPLPAQPAPAGPIQTAGR